MKTPKLTIIILDYLKAKYVVENVKTLMSQDINFDYKIIVIDNSCNKKNEAFLKKNLNYPNLELIINKENLGYTKAHNKISNKISGQYILLLNPNIIWKDEKALYRMLTFLEKHEKVWIVGPKQIKDNWSIKTTVRGFPKLYRQVSRRTFLRHVPFLKQSVEYDEMKHLDLTKAQDVDWIESSCLLIRKNIWDEIWWLDESYFVFMSDVELCFQAWKKWYEVAYFPQAQVYSNENKNELKGFWEFFRKKLLRTHLKDALKYKINHIGEKNPKNIYLKKQKSSIEDMCFDTPMKWIVLAGWAWTRLDPITRVTSKQLLPIYNKPMIYYPIETLIKAWIKEILIIVAPENAWDFLKLLWSWKEFWVKFTYEIQDKPNWISQAFIIWENFIWRDNVTLILWDNIFEDNISKSIQEFESWAKIFAQKVKDPQRFWVIEFDKNKKVISIEEKPKKPKSSYAQTWIYICDNTVIKKVKQIKPSKRWELEITDLIKVYFKEASLQVDIIDGQWFDTWTHESMFEASSYVRRKEIWKNITKLK